MSIPLKHSAISLIIHIVIVGVLLGFTDLGVYALLIGNITFPLTVSAMNCRSVSKILGYSFKWVSSMIKPCICAVIMGLVTFFVYLYLPLGRMPRFLLSIVFAVLFYGIIIVLTKTVSREELVRMPVVGKIVRKLI